MNNEKAIVFIGLAVSFISTLIIGWTNGRLTKMAVTKLVEEALAKRN